MSKPTPKRLHKKELKRKKEHKLMRALGVFSDVWKEHKEAILLKVKNREKKSRKNDKDKS